MKIRLDITKSIEENAQEYFAKAKKARKKITGAKEAYTQALKQAQQAKQQQAKIQEKQQLKDPETHWYHKYRWSKTRNGHLIVAGQNASANEAIIKNHTQPTDIVFHTDMAGSPFTLLRAEKGVELTEDDYRDAAQLTAAYSKAWKRGLASQEVFHVQPSQVTKEAQTGEYLPKGSFMIRGDTTYHSVEVELAIGVIDKQGYKPEVFVGSLEACKAHCLSYGLLRPGDTKTSSIAKQLNKFLHTNLDALIRAIPAGNTRIVTQPTDLEYARKQQS